jgi:hypothetical protein
MVAGPSMTAHAADTTLTLACRHSNRRLQAGAADMTRTLVAYALAAALLASSAHAQSLLPSQESATFSVSEYAEIVRFFLQSKLALLMP